MLQALQHCRMPLESKTHDICIQHVQRHSASCCCASARCLCRSLAISSKCSCNASSSPAKASKALNSVRGLPGRQDGSWGRLILMVVTSTDAKYASAARCTFCTASSREIPSAPRSASAGINARQPSFFRSMSTAYSINAPSLSAPGGCCTLCQLLQQCSGLLEVGSVKALGEPAVDGLQQLSGCFTLALVLQQAAQAYRRPQLPRLRLLAAGHIEGLAEAGFRLLLVRDGPLPQQLTLQPVQLCLIVTFASFIHRCQCLGQHGQPGFGLSRSATGLG